MNRDQLAETMYKLCIDHNELLEQIKQDCLSGKVKYKKVNQLSIIKELIIQNTLSLARTCMETDRAGQRSGN